MMEEVGDDTNGESTFEFVGGKTEENLNKSDLVSSTTLANNDVPTEVTSNIAMPHIVQASSRQLVTQSSAGIFVPPAATYTDPSTQFIPAASSAVSPIPMYNPNQQIGLSTMTYFPTPMMPSQSYQTASAVENKPTNAYSVPGVSSSSQEYVSNPVDLQSTYTNPPTAAPQAALELPLDDNIVSSSDQHHEDGEKGVWGWIKGNDFLNRVAVKAKNSVDSVITTLDPGMKEIIYSGGDVNVIVASSNETKVSTVREAFQQVFGRATVHGIAVQSSSIAPQPVGFSAGVKAAEERISNLRQQGLVHEQQVIVAVENFLAELTPEKWFDLGCIILQDPNTRIDLQIYTEAIPVPANYVMQAKDQTPPDYPLGWSGYAVTIGQVLGPALGVHHSEWHQALTGVPRRDILFLAAKTLAGMYKAQLRS